MYRMVDAKNNANANTAGTKTRYALIDALRGATIISMVLYHFFYDVCVVFGRDPAFPGKAFFWQQSICQTFILIAGFAWSLGQKNNLRRGLLLNLCGLLVTVVTLLFLPAEAIYFGILNFLGCAVLLLIPLRRLMENIPPYAGLLGSFLCFVFFRRLPLGSVGLGAFFQLPLPEVLYRSDLLAPLGLPSPAFRSADYFPLLPWFFLFLSGFFFFRIFLRHPALQRVAKTRVPLLSALGQKSLLVYLIHQPVCYFIALLLYGLR